MTSLEEEEGQKPTRKGKPEVRERKLEMLEENMNSIMEEEPNQNTKSAGEDKEKVCKRKVKKFRKSKVRKKIE